MTASIKAFREHEDFQLKFNIFWWWSAWAEEGSRSVDCLSRSANMWCASIFSFGYWFRESCLEAAKPGKGFVRSTWSHQGRVLRVEWERKFYRCSHLFANDLIMKIKYDTERDMIPRDCRNSSSLRTLSCFFFYYSNNSKSYFGARCVFYIFRSFGVRGREWIALRTLFPLITSTEEQKKILFALLLRRVKMPHTREREGKRQWKIIKLTNDLHYPYVEKTA